jgi:hypothetical protein
MNDTTSGQQAGQTSGASGSPRDDWKRRQAIRPAAPRYIEPTLPERINRLRPSERHELQTLIKSMKLRKIIRRMLAEAFWDGETAKIASAANDSMSKLRATVRAHESLLNYERALTVSSSATTFEPTITTQQPTIIEVPRA